MGNARVPAALKFDFHVLLVQHGKHCKRCAKNGKNRREDLGPCPLGPALRKRMENAIAAAAKKGKAVKTEVKKEFKKKVKTEVKKETKKVKREVKKEIKKEVKREASRAGSRRCMERESQAKKTKVELKTEHHFGLARIKKEM